MEDWQPIETLPRNKAVLVCSLKGRTVARLEDDGWWAETGGQLEIYPTHWMEPPVMPIVIDPHEGG